VLAGDGFLLFKLRSTLYRVLGHTNLDTADDKKSPLKYWGGLMFVGDIHIDGRCLAMKLKDQCLMMATDRNTLYIFDLTSPSEPPSELANGASAATDASILTPSSTIDLWLVGTNGTRETPDNTIGYTTCIEFSDKYIFHATSEKFRIVCRATERVVYSIQEATWRNVAPGRWSKCISPHAFVVPIATGRRLYHPQQPWTEGSRPRDEIVHIEHGTGRDRKDKPWRWDVVQMVAKNGTLVMSFGGGWIVGLPDFEMLVDGKRTLDDVDACWVLDIGAPCSDMLFDGRRIVWNHVRSPLPPLPRANKFGDLFADFCDFRTIVESRNCCFKPPFPPRYACPGWGAYRSHFSARMDGCRDHPDDGAHR